MGNKAPGWARPGVYGPPVEQIIAAVARAFDVEPESITGRRRRTSVALPRMVAYYLARECTRHSLAELAPAFHRDRTTVLVGARRMRARLRDDGALALVVGRLLAELEEVERCENTAR